MVVKKQLWQRAFENDDNLQISKISQKIYASILKYLEAKTFGKKFKSWFKKHACVSSQKLGFIKWLIITYFVEMVVIKFCVTDLKSSGCISGQKCWITLT